MKSAVFDFFGIASARARARGDTPSGRLFDAGEDFRGPVALVRDLGADGPEPENYSGPVLSPEERRAAKLEQSLAAEMRDAITPLVGASFSPVSKLKLTEAVRTVLDRKLPWAPCDRPIADAMADIRAEVFQAAADDFRKAIAVSAPYTKCGHRDLERGIANSGMRWRCVECQFSVIELWRPDTHAPTGQIATYGVLSRMPWRKQAEAVRSAMREYASAPRKTCAHMHFVSRASGHQIEHTCLACDAWVQEYSDGRFDDIPF